MQETDPDSFTTGIAYNGKDEVTGVTDARSLSTSYVRDGFGDIIQQTSPDTGTTVFWFDAHGNVTKKVDARSVETDTTYDALDRVLTRTFPADTAENVTYTYDATSGGNDGVGRLTKVTDQSGSTSFVYNALGQIVTDSRAVGSNIYAATYTFDPAGHPLVDHLSVWPHRHVHARRAGTRLRHYDQAELRGDARDDPFERNLRAVRRLCRGEFRRQHQHRDRLRWPDYKLTSIAATVGRGDPESLLWLRPVEQRHRYHRQSEFGTVPGPRL